MCWLVPGAVIIESFSVEVAVRFSAVPVPVFVQVIVTVNGPTVNRGTVFPPAVPETFTIPLVPTLFPVVR